jgi:hypothetical protein
VSEFEAGTAGEDLEDVTDVVRGEREGLPPGYRMRADRHYVEELTQHDVQLSPRSSGQPNLTDRTAGLLASLSEEVAAIGAARRLLADSGALGRRTALDLIEGHTLRAAWLIRAAGLVAGTDRRPGRRQPIGRLIDDLIEQLAAEARLRGLAIRGRVDDRAYAVRFDDEVLSIGLTGAIFALLPFVDAGDERPMTIHVARPAASLTVDLAHPATSMDGSSARGFFDEAWTARPGGWPAMLGALALTRAVAHHGGEVSCSVDQGSFRLRISFPEKA